jgi:hypothetical protein
MNSLKLGYLNYCHSNKKIIFTNKTTKTMSEQKIYCGSGQTKNDGWQKVNICLSDLPKEYITTAKNGKKYISLNINKKKEADQYGKDLAVSVDTWKPTPQEQAPAPAMPPAPTIIDDLQSGELPF